LRQYYNYYKVNIIKQT